MARKIKSRNERPDITIGISGGGLIPARIIRSFLKQKGGKNISIQAIGLLLYERFKLQLDTLNQLVRKLLQING